VVRPLKCFVNGERFLRMTKIRERLKLEAAENPRLTRTVRRQNLSAAITLNTKDRQLRFVTLHEDRNGGQLRARVKRKRAAGICQVLVELERVTQ
jgi:hypothetical protein